MAGDTVVKKLTFSSLNEHFIFQPVVIFDENHTPHPGLSIVPINVMSL